MKILSHMTNGFGWEVPGLRRRPKSHIKPCPHRPNERGGGIYTDRCRSCENRAGRLSGSTDSGFWARHHIDIDPPKHRKSGPARTTYSGKWLLQDIFGGEFLSE